MKWFFHSLLILLVVINTYADDATEYFNRGSAKQAKGDLDGAIADYGKAIKLNPHYVKAYSHRAVAELLAHDLKDALNDCNRVIEIQPDNAAQYAFRGLVEQTKGDLDGALADYSKAIELKPDDDNAYNLRGDLERRADHWTSAMADYNKAIELNPDYAEAYVHRGMVKAALKDLDGAISDYDAAIKLKPNDVEAYLARGLLKAAKHDSDGAMNDLDKAIDLNPANAASYIARGELKEKQHDFSGAIADYDRAISRAHGIKLILARAYSGRGQAKEAEGDSNGALSDVNQAIQLNAEDALAYNIRGWINYNSHKFVDALADLRKTCALTSRVNVQDYAHFYIWLTRARMGEQAAATKGLEAYWSSRKDGTMEDWRSKICEFLTGHLSEASLFKAAENSDLQKSRDRQCEAYFYAGSKQLISGDKMTAVDYFKKCMATGRTNNGEYVSAAAELKTLAKAK